MKYSTISILDKEHLINILSTDLSTNYQIGLHNTSINEEFFHCHLQKMESIFSKGYRVDWGRLSQFSMPYGDLSKITGEQLDNFYEYNYWGGEYYQNYIFAFPKYISIDGKNCFLGSYSPKVREDNLLNAYLFFYKNIPSEFIYGCLLKDNDVGYRLVKNPKHLCYKNPLEKEKFYDTWLNKEERDALLSVAEKKIQENPYYALEKLINKNIRQEQRILQKSKSGK